MKILCIADHVDPLVYSNTIKTRFRDVALVLAAGDLPLEYYGYIVSLLNKPLLFVFGNHNLERIDQFRRNLPSATDGAYLNPMSVYRYGSTYIGGKVTRSLGLLIAGQDGSMRYNNGANQYTDAAMAFQLLRLVPRLLVNRLVHGRFLDVFLTHSPPFGVNDRSDDVCHRGFKPFLLFLRLFKPRYLIHGHVHLYDRNASRVATYGKTTVINAYDHFILEID